MDKSDVVRILEEIAIFQEFAGVNPFEVRAFRNGSTYLDEWQGDLQEAVRDNTLPEIYGIGKGIASVVRELVETGRSEKHDKLRSEYPETLLDVFRIPGLGMKKIKILYAELGIDSIDALESAASNGRISALKGFGAKSEEQILRRVTRMRERASKH